MSVQTDPLSDGIDALNGSRYDWLLVAIPIPLLLGWGASVTLPIALSVGMGVGALPAGGLVLYALFVDAPVVGSESSGARADDLDIDPEADLAQGAAVDDGGFGSRAGPDETEAEPANGSVPGSDD